mgnify:CR=1 FL=1
MDVRTRLRLVDGWVDLERGQVERDVPVSLTDRETRMLGYLAARPATPCATEELLQEVWGYNARVRSRAVDAAVHRLRRKLEVDPKNPVHLVTVYGKGVYFRPAEPEARRVEGDFVGREELLEELVECLEQRSVQLMGAGGVGKTRVARELLARRDGVFCSLSQETDIAGAVRAIAWTLGVDPDLVASGEASLAEAMGARGLVVLDNVEWVTGIGPWIDALGPEVRVLATTRRQLEGYLEKVVLSPLGLDDSVALLQSLTGLGRTPALDAVASAGQPHHFLAVTKTGRSAIAETTGNADCHIILRGGKTTNYDGNWNVTSTSTDFTDLPASTEDGLTVYTETDNWGGVTKYYVDGDMVDSDRYYTYSTLQEGSHAVRVEVSTDFGETALAETTIDVVSNKPPVCELETSERSTIYTIEALCEDEDGKIKGHTWTIDGYESSTSFKRISIRKSTLEGGATVEMYATDDSGDNSNVVSIQLSGQ